MTQATRASSYSLRSNSTASGISMTAKLEAQPRVTSVNKMGWKLGLRLNSAFSQYYLWGTWARFVSDLPPLVGAKPLLPSPSPVKSFLPSASQLRAQQPCHGDWPPLLPALRAQSLCTCPGSDKTRAEDCLCCWPLAFLLRLFPAFFLQGHYCFQGGKGGSDPVSSTNH